MRKQGDEIDVEPISTVADFNRIHFFLLGNRFETLYLPSAIVLVEGKCDASFIERVVALRYPASQVSVVPAHSDSRIKEILSVARGLLADLQRSPYRDRIFVVLDSIHSSGLPDDLARMGVERDNIVIWPKNGIEFYYPPSVVDSIFGAGPELEIVGDVVSRNGLSFTKRELVEKVVAALGENTAMESGFRDLFLTRLDGRIA